MSFAHNGGLTMKISLRQMTAEEFQQYRRPGIRRLASALKRAWQLSPFEASTAARRVFERSITELEREPTKGGIFIVEAERRAVGVLWYTIQCTRGFSEAYVFDIFIKPTERRRGYAAAALRAMEKVARDESVSRVCLNVFEHNVKATRFYKKNGFRVASHGLMKSLT